MSTPHDAAERRKLRAIARRYEREGYRVTTLEDGTRLPAFLEGCRPDLIAESEQDRVVVDVKRADAVRGANDLQEIAERVWHQPGWRFELVTLPSVRHFAPPNAESLEVIEHRVRQAVGVGLTDMAHRYVVAMIEEWLSDFAEREGLKIRNAPFARILRDLAVRGLLSQEDYQAIQKARGVRTWPSSDGERLPTPGEIESLLALAHRLRAELAGTSSEDALSDA